MKLSAEEKMMYKVMKALYDCGIPVNFKGSMVLKACLMEAGFTEDTRHTVDIDGNWYSETAPTGDQMEKSLQRALDQNNLPLDVKESLWKISSIWRKNIPRRKCDDNTP